MTAEETINDVAASLGLTMKAEFVPWSKSRNAGEKRPSLNWKVALYKDGQEILRTDYGAGEGHCESYKASVKELGYRNSIMRDTVTRQECETGKKWRSEGKRYEPLLADVLHSLVSDADAIDYPTYEEWAPNLGYDPDSRKGKPFTARAWRSA